MMKLNNNTLVINIFYISLFVGILTGCGRVHPSPASIIAAATPTVTPSPTATPTPTASPVVTYSLNWSTPDNWGSVSVSPTGTSTGSQSAAYPVGTVVTITATAQTPTFKFGCFVGTTENTKENGTATVTQQVNHVTMNSDITFKACFPFTGDTSGTCPESECN